MKLLFLTFFISTSSFAVDFYATHEFSTENLVCVYNRPGGFGLEGTTTSCVSKASIEKDKVELEILKRQLEAMKQKDVPVVKLT